MISYSPVTGTVLILGYYTHTAVADSKGKKNYFMCLRNLKRFATALLPQYCSYLKSEAFLTSEKAGNLDDNSVLNDSVFPFTSNPYLSSYSELS